jgi:phosphocarrier protein HPr
LTLNSGHSAFSISHSAFVSMPHVERDVVVVNKLGLHARPAMQFVDLANQFTSNISVHKAAMGDEEAVDADGKSVMAMIILAATEGTTLKIVADGDDAEKAVNDLIGLFQSKFGED